MGEKENRELYNEYHTEVNSRILSNIENHDKAILSLSTAVLGVSLAFIKDIVPIGKLIDINVLYISWGALIFAIISVMISFWTGNKANNKHLEYAKKYYIENEDNAFNNKSWWFTATEILNQLSGILFILGIISTAYFVGSNISIKEEKENVQITEKSISPPNPKQSKEETMSKELIQKGVPAPKIKPKTDQSK